MVIHLEMAAGPFIFSTKKHNNNLSENIATEFQRKKKSYDKSLGYDFENHSKTPGSSGGGSLL